MIQLRCCIGWILIAAILDASALAEDYGEGSQCAPHEWDLGSPPRRPVDARGRKRILIGYLTSIMKVPSWALGMPSQLQDDEIHELLKCMQKTFAGTAISGVVKYAIEKVNNDPNLLPDYYLDFIYNNTCDDSLLATRHAMRMWRAGVDVLFGPESQCATVAELAGAQALPVISYKQRKNLIYTQRCSDPELSDKERFPTFARTVPAAADLTYALFSLLLHFKWHRFSVLYSLSDGDAAKRTLLSILKEKDHLNAQMANQQQQDNNLFRFKRGAFSSGGSGQRNSDSRPSSMQANNDQPPQFVVVNHTDVGHTNDAIQASYERVKKSIAHTSATTRIYIVFGSSYLLRMTLRALDELGLLDTNKYAVIALAPHLHYQGPHELMNSDMFRNTSRIKLSEHWESDEGKKSVRWFRHALLLGPSPIVINSDEYSTFWKKSQFYLQSEFDMNVQKSGFVSFEGNRPACYLYDAIWQYANALHDYMRSTDGAVDPRKAGPAVMRALRSKPYESIQGFRMHLDEKGDAHGNYSVLSMQPVPPSTNTTSGKYYPFESAMRVAAVFDTAFPTDTPEIVTGVYRSRRDAQPQSSADGIPLPSIRFELPIDWPGGEVPLDQPLCGFDNRRCEEGQVWLSVLCSLLGILILAVTLVALFVYRTQRYERQLAGLIWRIDPKEIYLQQALTVGSLDSVLSGSKNSLLMTTAAASLSTSQKHSIKDQYQHQQISRQAACGQNSGAGAVQVNQVVQNGTAVYSMDEQEFVDFDVFL